MQHNIIPVLVVLNTMKQVLVVSGFIVLIIMKSVRAGKGKKGQEVQTARKWPLNGESEHSFSQETF